MPLYEYYCHKCQNDCELLIRGSETPVCPRCGSKKLNRQMSAPAAHASGANCSTARSCGVDPASCERRSGGGCCGHRCPH